jgi:hypothetical protein
VDLADAQFTGTLRALALDPAEQLLIAGGDDKRVSVWETATGKLRKTWYDTHLVPGLETSDYYNCHHYNGMACDLTIVLR